MGGIKVGDGSREVCGWFMLTPSSALSHLLHFGCQVSLQMKNRVIIAAAIFKTSPMFQAQYWVGLCTNSRSIPT